MERLVSTPPTIVSIHEVFQVDVASSPPMAFVDMESARVDSEELAPNLVVNLASFTLALVMRVRFWTPRAEVAHWLKQDRIGNCIPDECSKGRW